MAWANVLAQILALVVGQTALLANPHDPAVVAGHVLFSTDGHTLSINASDHSIINWQGFSIGHGEITQFVQPDSHSVVLNRVTSSDPSSIYGTLQSNGIIYLVNPNGILVGPGGQINTNGFIGSALDITNQQFLNGGNLHFQGSSSAGVINHGAIRAVEGNVMLIGANVANYGTISALNGTVGLAAGQSVTLVDSARPSLVVEATSASINTPSVANAGVIEAVQAQLVAAHGNVYALAINNTGTVRANGVARDDQGNVFLVANGGKVVNTGNLIAANGDGSGGQVSIAAGREGSAEVSGKIDVSSATGSGGSVNITGDQVALTAANVNASGVSGGGDVYVGGGARGANPNLLNATNTTLDANTIIRADALTKGNGGNIAIWSNNSTQLFGSLSALGGMSGGNGGLIEVSGRNTLLFVGMAGTLAPLGRTGTLLLDPDNFTITAGSDAQTSNSIGAATLVNLLGSNNVTISTSSTGSNAGDILINADVAWSTANSLTLSAFHDISVASGVAITSSGGGSLSLQADGTGTGAGTLVNSGTISVSGGGSLNLYYNPVTFGAQDSFTGISVTGSGSFTPYMLVNNLTNLQAINNNLGGSYALGTNIDATATTDWNSGAGFVPLGNSATRFIGNFDGGGHTISNLTINLPNGSNVGLFGVADTAAVIQNVGLVNVQVTGNQFVGGLAGQNYGRISNAYSTGADNAVVGSQNIGGLVGQNGSSGRISNAYSTGAVTAGANGLAVGGLVGGNGGSIINAYSTGTVNAGVGSQDVGGLAGLNGFGGSITNAYSTGTVNAGVGSQDVGGLVGANIFFNGRITNAYSTGAVTAGSNSLFVGGLAGQNGYSCSISNAYSSGTVTVGTGSQYVGGLVGQNFNGSSITNAYSTAAVNVGNNGQYVGGLVGQNIFGGRITNAYSTGAVNVGTGSQDVGGLVGQNGAGGSVRNSFWDTQTSGQSTSAGGTGLTTAQFFSNANFSSATTDNGNQNPNWDFTATWYQLNGATRPFLQFEYGTTITNAHQLQLIGMNATTLAADYTLAVNLDLSVTQNPADIWNTATGFVPLGNEPTPFTGNFDGGGHTISNLTINLPNGGFVGLFGVADTAAVIQNVGLVNVQVTGSQGVGGLVGANFGGSITNAYSSGTVTAGANGLAVGGLVGANLFDGGISNAYSSGTVNVGANGQLVGGLVGANFYGSKITNAYSTAAVNAGANGGLVGGLVGANLFGGSITNAYSTGAVNVGTGSQDVGGLVGQNAAGGSVRNSFWDTQTSGQSTSAGGTGLTTAQFFSNANFSSATTDNGNQNPNWDFTATWYQLNGATRPFLQFEYGTTITNAHQLQLIGMNATTLAADYTLAVNLDLSATQNPADIWNTATGFVPLGNDATPFTGNFDGGGHTISNLTINLPSGSNVGLFGVADIAAVIQNVGLVNVQVTGNRFVGGLVGQNLGNISNAYSTGVVNAGDGSQYVGGLVGLNGYGGRINNAYSTAAVNAGVGSQYVGGLVGQNLGIITNAYSTGTVTIASKKTTASVISATIVQNSFQASQANWSSNSPFTGIWYQNWIDNFLPWALPSSALNLNIGNTPGWPRPSGELTGGSSFVSPGLTP